MSTYPSLLFITRKYPGLHGGMEEFSQRLYEAYPGRKDLVALKGRQGWLPLYLPYALLRSALARGRFDHVHLGDAMMAILAPLFGHLTRATVTATLHGQDALRTLGWYRALLRRALDKMDGRLIAVSDFTAAETSTTLGIPTPYVIHNGLQWHRFGRIERAPGQPALRVALGFPASGPLIVTVGRLVRRKGVTWFASNVLPLLPPDVTYVVVGDGPDRAAVREAWRRDPRIHLCGDVDDRFVEQLYTCCDLVVAANIRVAGSPEGYGIAPAEAAAAGVPTLVSDIEGLRDMARVTGVRSIPSGDAHEWASAVGRALTDPSWALATRPPRSWEHVAEDYALRFATLAGKRLARSRDRSAAST
ncbi:MAG: glycosyltransferase [Dehalococcoidia bacterium]|nr:glycosyltransferase [Dehalococcoidia bacterium]